MEGSSSISTKDEILPYQFEPTRQDKEDGSDCSWETVSELEGDSDIEEQMRKEERNDVDAETWCTCGNC